MDVFRLRPILSDKQNSDLVSWFWTTTYGEYFAGMSGDRIEKAKKDLARGLDSGNWALTQFDPFEVSTLRRKFDFRAVRAKAFALRLSDVKENILPSPNAQTLLSEYGRECMLQLLPRTNSRKSIYSSYANRFMVNPKDGNTFKDKLISGQLTAIELQSMLIDSDMADSIATDNHERFIELRIDVIDRKEREFYTPHLSKMAITSASK